MTRYLCNDPTHRRGVQPRPVDVTSQVRLERALVPRAPTILAHTEQLMETVLRIDHAWAPDRRYDEIRRMLTGGTDGADLPVVLVSRDAVTRPPGLYEMDELRMAEPVVDRVAGLGAGAGGELVILGDPRSQVASGEAQRGGGVETRTADRRTLIVPQGVFSVVDLSRSLAYAGRDEEAVIEAIRRTPTVAAEDAERARPSEPWRVVITCPEPEGVPPLAHRTVFTGSGEAEPSVMIGTPVNGVDIALESSAEVDLGPANAVASLERRVKVLLAAEVAIVAVGLLFAWAAGSLGLAARETPGWLAFAVLLGLGAITFAAVPLFAGNRTNGNADDTFELRRYYGSRLELLSIAPAVSAGMFALALLCAVVPPSLTADDPLPPVSIAFDPSIEPVGALVSVDARDIATDETLHVEMRRFTSSEDVGSLVGRMTTTGTPSGEVPLSETVALGSDARYLSVQVWIDDSDEASSTAPPGCMPPLPSGAGCTVVAVPTVAGIDG